MLGIVGTALLLIPRRSSKQAALDPENRPMNNSEEYSKKNSEKSANDNK